MKRVSLEWKRFETFREARKIFRGIPCIYAMTDGDEAHVLKIGQSQDLWKRYLGGTGYTVDAVMHGTGNRVFVAAGPADKWERETIEAILIFKSQPPYCVQKKKFLPPDELEIQHHGDAPKTMP